MTQELTIIDNNNGVSVDLLSGTLTLGEERNWRTTPMGNGLVQETMQLVAKGTAANIKIALDTLDDLRGQCELWIDDDYEQNCVWLYQGASTETSSKRSLVYSIETFILNQNRTTLLLDNTGIKVQLTLVRNDTFEDVSATNSTLSAFTWSNCHQTLSSIRGNIPARINDLKAVPSGFTSDNMNEFYVGIRRVRAMQNSIPVEPTIDAYAHGTIWASADTSKSTARSGYTGSGHMRTTFATDTTMNERFYWYFSDWVGTQANRQVQDWAGDWHILVRYTCDSTYYFRCQLSVDFPAADVDNRIYTRPQVVPRSIAAGNVPSTWDLLDLGVIHIPPWGVSPTVDDTVYLDNMRFIFWAEPLGSAANLDIDGFLLIPADHFLHVSGIDANPSDGGEFHLINSADGDISAYTTDSSSVATSGGKIARNKWVLPNGNLDVVAVAMTENNNHRTDMSLALTFSHNRTWYNIQYPT